MTPTEFRAIYKGLRLTQEGIAAKLDVHPATIRAWKQRGVPVMAALAIRQVEWEMQRREFDDVDDAADVNLGTLSFSDIAGQMYAGLRDLAKPVVSPSSSNRDDDDGCD